MKCFAIHPGACLTVALVVIFQLAHAQSVHITGTTLDSLNQPVPLVTVQAGHQKIFSVTRENGFFSIDCTIGDTILFSRLGYIPTKLIALRSMDSVRVKMRHANYLLQPVTIYGSYKPFGQDRWKSSYKTSSPFRNSTMPLSTADIYAPNPTIQTFGPGVVMSGVFSQFSKSEKEKKKLKKVEEAQLRTKTFREVMHSDETKEYLRELFHLTEEEYYKKIEAFNLANPEVPNLASKEEILNVLVRFFALKD